MLDVFQQGMAGFFQQSALELLAVALGIAYLVLAMRQNSWCWPCAFISTAIFTWVFFDVSLIMESLLNVYYMLMAVYGYWCWRTGKGNKTTLAINFWSSSQHLYALTIVAGLTFVSGYFLSRHTAAAWPYLDSFTTWGAVVTTFMVARKIFENWIYWLVIDSVALFLYWDRGLYPTALLMMVYLVLVVIGIYAWSRQLSRNNLPEGVNV
ncbi:nicotinamide riboside transporter PnuC [Teredinibacter haidensis]|uniref:nicotinamide riboside transporter PnuC n=1 Tax=Teredinibacter haidensis TaxID=2731755 RepID=UPI000948BFA2|nr:nicotinamide riboside transporter PnuC [Teredinibacter haidensis]